MVLGSIGFPEGGIACRCDQIFYIWALLRSGLFLLRVLPMIVVSLTDTIAQLLLVFKCKCVHADVQGARSSEVYTTRMHSPSNSLLLCVLVE